MLFVKTCNTTQPREFVWVIACICVCIFLCIIWTCEWLHFELKSVCKRVCVNVIFNVSVPACHNVIYSSYIVLCSLYSFIRMFVLELSEYACICACVYLCVWVVVVVAPLYKSNENTNICFVAAAGSVCVRVTTTVAMILMSWALFIQQQCVGTWFLGKVINFKLNLNASSVGW